MGDIFLMVALIADPSAGALRQPLTMQAHQVAPQQYIVVTTVIYVWYQASQ